MRGRGASPFTRYQAGNYADVPARAATAMLVCEGACNSVLLDLFEEKRAAFAEAVNSEGRIPPPPPPKGRSLHVTLHQQVGPGRWRCTRCGVSERNY